MVKEIEVKLTDFYPTCVNHYSFRKTVTTETQSIMKYLTVVTFTLVVSFSIIQVHNFTQFRSKKNGGNELDNFKQYLREREIQRSASYIKLMDKLIGEEKQCIDRAEVQEQIEQALLKYDADKTGLYDYAALYSGAIITSTPNTKPYPINKTITFLNLVSVEIFSQPELMIDSSVFPGNCFSFHGNEGRIRIKLGKKVPVRSVGVEHSPFSLIEDPTSAPKDFAIYGLENENDANPTFLGKFAYQLIGKPIQIFYVDPSKVHYYEHVELHVLTNHGKRDFTCVYRFRVHATIPIH